MAAEATTDDDVDVVVKASGCYCTMAQSVWDARKADISQAVTAIGPHLLALNIGIAPKSPGILRLFAVFSAGFVDGSTTSVRLRRLRLGENFAKDIDDLIVDIVTYKEQVKHVKGANMRGEVVQK